MKHDQKIAYLAGLIDGEGCLRVEALAMGRAFRPYLAIKMTDQAVIRWLQNEFGGEFSAASVRDTEAPTYSWIIRTKEPLVRLLPALIDCLHTKRVHAIILLEFCQRFPRRSGGWKGGFSEAAHQEMLKYKTLFDVLNAKGPDSVEPKLRVASFFGRPAP